MEGKPLDILLIEDNLAHAEMVMRSLQDHHIANRVHHVLDGQSALDFLYRQRQYTDPQDSPRPHLVLLDLRLPKINGLQVLQRIKHDPALATIPVVVLTTSGAERDVNSAYDSYVNSYLVKPIDFAKFSQLIKDLGFYWLIWNRQPDSDT